METLVVHPDTKEQLVALKTFMKAFKISYEDEKSTYDPEFVKMIRQGDEDLKAGKGVILDIDKLFIGKIEKGLEDIKEGRSLNYEDVKQKIFDKKSN